MAGFPPQGTVLAIMNVQEQYTLTERYKLAGVDTIGTSLTLSTSNAKVVVISCANDAIIWDVVPLSANSPRIAKDGSYSFTVGSLSQPLTIYVKAENTTADVYIQVYT